MTVYSKYKTKPRQRGRKKSPKPSSRKVALWFFIITTNILILLKVATWLNAQELFEFKHLKIVGTKYTQQKEILNYAKIDSSLSLFKLDLKLIAEHVKKHPLVQNAVVSRRLPSTLIIQVEEKKPIALLNQNQLLPIDANGDILNGLKPDMLFDLPIISNVEAGQETNIKEIVDFLNYIKKYQFPLYCEISEISFSQKVGIYFCLVDDSIPVVLGKGNYQTKGQHFTKVLSIVKGKKQLSDVEFFDLRFENQVIVKESIKS